MTSRVFLRYRVDNRIQAYSIKNRPVLGLGWSFGEPQLRLELMLVEGQFQNCPSRTTTLLGCWPDRFIRNSVISDFSRDAQRDDDGVSVLSLRTLDVISRVTFL